MASRRHPRKGPPIPLASYTCTDTAFQIKKAYTPLFLASYQQVSSLRHSLAPYLYTLYDFISQYTLLDTPDSALAQIHESESCLALNHLLASTTTNFSRFPFSCFIINSERRRGGSGGIFSDYYPLYRGINLATVEWVIKSEGGHIFSFAFLSVILHTNVGLLASALTPSSPSPKIHTLSTELTTNSTSGFSIGFLSCLISINARYV
jgi:hypothetical protein